MTSVARNVRCVRKTFRSLVACYLYVYILGIHSSNEVSEAHEKNIKEEFGPYTSNNFESKCFVFSFAGVDMTT